MRIGAAGFDWDSGNWPKCGKHGLSQADIESLFEAEPAVYPDVAHSHDEQRMLAIGTVSTGRYVLVAFTLRQTDAGTQIRPVSARYMHKKEIAHYEQQRQTQAAPDADQ